MLALIMLPRMQMVRPSKAMSNIVKVAVIVVPETGVLVSAGVEPSHLALERRELGTGAAVRCGCELGVKCVLAASLHKELHQEVLCTQRKAELGLAGDKLLNVTERTNAGINGQEK
ncbi:hypothetical protein QOT17_024959 [Balamuthia mandrillaris]